MGLMMSDGVIFGECFSNTIINIGIYPADVSDRIQGNIRGAGFSNIGAAGEMTGTNIDAMCSWRQYRKRGNTNEQSIQSA